MNRLLVLLMLVPALTHADDGYKVLFKSTPIPVADQIAIYHQLGLKLAPGGKRLDDEDCGVELPGMMGSDRVTTTDLNHDGVPEVIVSEGVCNSGAEGPDLHVFVKSGSGYRLSATGKDWHALPERSKGYSDPLVHVYGHCEEVLRWNGERYAHSKYKPGFPGGCDILEHK